MKTINAILIDADLRTVTVVPFDADGDHLAQYYKLLQCQLVTGVYPANGDTGFVDDEGLLINPQNFFECELIHPEPLASRCLIVGIDWDDEGEETMRDPKMTVEEVLADIKWFTLLEMKLRYSNARQW
jgi:hypothetical protein